LPEIELNGC